MEEQSFNIEEKITEGLNNVRKRAIEEPLIEFTPLEIRRLHGLYFQYLTAQHILKNKDSSYQIGQDLVEIMTNNGYLSTDLIENAEIGVEQIPQQRKKIPAATSKIPFNPSGKTFHSRPNKTVWPENVGKYRNDN